MNIVLGMKLRPKPGTSDWDDEVWVVAAGPDAAGRYLVDCIEGGPFSGLLSPEEIEDGFVIIEESE